MKKLIFLTCLLLLVSISGFALDGPALKNSATEGIVDIDNLIIALKEERPAKAVNLRTVVDKPSGVTKSARPDLVVSKINFSPGKPTVDAEITLWVFVKNIGQTRSETSKVRVKVGGESNPPVLAVPSLNPNQEFRYTKNLSFDRTGNFIVTVTADAQNDIAEIKEDNNVQTVTITVKPGPKPDLVVSRINYSPGSPKQHEQVKVWYFVKNNGPGIAKDAYLSTTNTLNASPIWNRKRIPDLPPGQEWRYDAYFISNQAGTYYLKAVADREQHVDETNEDNNSLDRKIVVGPPAN